MEEKNKIARPCCGSCKYSYSYVYSYWKYILGWNGGFRCKLKNISIWPKDICEDYIPFEVQIICRNILCVKYEPLCPEWGKCKLPKNAR
jgi:hypothetical protein